MESEHKLNVSVVSSPSIVYECNQNKSTNSYPISTSDDTKLSQSNTLYNSLNSSQLPTNELQNFQESWLPLDALLKHSTLSEPMDDSENTEFTNNNDYSTTINLWGRSKNELIQAYSHLPQGLEFYQVVASPRVLCDNHILESKHDLSSTQLRNDLSCPICKGILQKTVVVKNCLHRFCSDCIEKCFRIGMRECPQCRMHVPSRRSLRIDPIFDKIIQRLFTDVKAFEDKNQSILLESNKRLRVRLDDELTKTETEMNQSRSASPSPSLTGNSHPSPFPKKSLHLRLDESYQPRSGLVSLSSSSEYISLNDNKLSKAERRRKRRDKTNNFKKIPFDGLLKFELIPDPLFEDLPQWKQNNKFRTTGSLSVQQLGRFISHFLDIPKDSTIKFYTKNHKFPFEPHCSLAYIHHRSYAFSHERVVLYYTLRNYGDPNGGTMKGDKGYVTPAHTNYYLI